MPLDIRGLGNCNEKKRIWGHSTNNMMTQLTSRFDKNDMIMIWFMIHDVYWWLNNGFSAMDWRGMTGVMIDKWGWCMWCIGALYDAPQNSGLTVFLACTEKNYPETECPIRDCSVLYFLLDSGFHPNLYRATRHLYTRALVEALHRVQSSFEIL